MILFRISYYIEICNASYSAQCRRAQQSAYCILHCIAGGPSLQLSRAQGEGGPVSHNPPKLDKEKLQERAHQNLIIKYKYKYKYITRKKKAPQPCPCPALLGQDLSSSLVPIHHPAPPSFLHHAVQMYCKCTNPTNYMYLHYTLYNIQLVFLLRGNLQGVRKNIWRHITYNFISLSILRSKSLAFWWHTNTHTKAKLLSFLKSWILPKTVALLHCIVTLHCYTVL